MDVHSNELTARKGTRDPRYAAQQPLSEWKTRSEGRGTRGEQRLRRKTTAAETVDRRGRRRQRQGGR